MKNYKVRYDFDGKFKSVSTDNLEQAERIFNKVIHFIKQHEFGGTVALFNDGCLEKSFRNK